MCPRPKLTAKSGRNSQKLSQRVELKHSEVLLAYLEVAVRFSDLTHILIAVIAFLWDAPVQPF